jgi:DNA (cytosine-5)-methyltransferase 1
VSAGLTVASLCAGYGGLDTALAMLLPARMAWCAELDADASRVLAARFPGVPNLGDIKAVNWAATTPADIWTGGYPCQPFSQAGQRNGAGDPRHLWPHILSGIRACRPPLLVLENVQGHLSLGFDVVLAGLGAAGYGACWTLVTAAAAGAPHRRARLFCVAVRDDLGAPGNGGRPLAECRDGGWWGADDLFGAVPYAGRIPATGRMAAGVMYALPVPALPTPDATHGRKSSRTGPLLGGIGDVLLPTVTARDDGKTPEAHMAMKAAMTGGTRHAITSLSVLARNGLRQPGDCELLPTPLVTNRAGMEPSPSSAAGNRGRDLGALLKTPTAQLAVNGGSQHPDKRRAGGHGPTLADQVEHEMLPTPTAADGDRTSLTYPRAGDADLPEAVALLGTPRAADGIVYDSVESVRARQARGARDRGTLEEQAMLLAGVAGEAAESSRWGKYEPAVRRWEAVTGVPAPSPTVPGTVTRQRVRECAWKHGLDGWAATAMIRLGLYGAVLNPAFAEWMMDPPEPGWVTAVPGVSRSAQLRIIGNGVVPRQGAVALGVLLPMVPAAAWEYLAARRAGTRQRVA